MPAIRIAIVDDSSFSIAFIRDILEQNGFDVVGEAGSLEEVRRVIRETKPDLVTMDMTLPGTDGLECTRAVHEIDENIKVIVVSSMMDDEIVKEAKQNKVSAYLQKPVDADALVSAINRILERDKLYSFLNSHYVASFKEALLNGMNSMTKTLLTYKDEYVSKGEYKSKGMSVIVGAIGAFSGRMLIDFSKETAAALAAAMLKKVSVGNDDITAALGEFANIVCGNACSMLNRQNIALGLRIAPPSIFYGDKISISAPDFSTFGVLAQTAFGDILLNIGFKKGE